MPSYRVELKDPDSKETRTFYNIVADDQARARAIVEAKEQAVVDYRMDTTEFSDAEKAEKDGVLAGQQKGHLFAHRQAKPYKITSVTENKEG